MYLLSRITHIILNVYNFDNNIVKIKVVKVVKVQGDVSKVTKLKSLILKIIDTIIIICYLFKCMIKYLNDHILFL